MSPGQKVLTSLLCAICGAATSLLAVCILAGSGIRNLEKFELFKVNHITFPSGQYRTELHRLSTREALAKCFSGYTD